MKNYLVVLFLSCCLSAEADVLRIGLFSGTTIPSIEFMVTEGNFSLFFGAKEDSLSTGDVLTVTASEEVCRIKKNGSLLGSFKKIKIISLLADGTMLMRFKGPEPNAFTYGGHFEISTVKGRLKIINTIDLESYVAAVVESEAGSNAEPEFLKVQTILCRTYALSHLERHSAELFELCDQVHCQSYKGKSRFNNKVIDAVDATRNKVLVKNRKLIIAAYHSNCGGQTVSADSVWSSHVPYLLSVVDTFCLKENHAQWRFALPEADWKRYLNSKGVMVSFIDSLDSDSLYLYHPPGRQTSMTYLGKCFQLKSVRDDFKLKSTWFNIDVKPDSVIFTGRGFGHGVGMCQEGAMKQAEVGRKYLEIINSYFHNVRLADADIIRIMNGKP